MRRVMSCGTCDGWQGRTDPRSEGANPLCPGRSLLRVILDLVRPATGQVQAGVRDGQPHPNCYQSGFRMSTRKAVMMNLLVRADVIRRGMGRRDMQVAGVVRRLRPTPWYLNRALPTRCLATGCGVRAPMSICPCCGWWGTEYPIEQLGDSESLTSRQYAGYCVTQGTLVWEVWFGGRSAWTETTA